MGMLVSLLVPVRSQVSKVLSEGPESDPMNSSSNSSPIYLDLEIRIPTFS